MQGWLTNDNQPPPHLCQDRDGGKSCNPEHSTWGRTVPHPFRVLRDSPEAAACYVEKSRLTGCSRAKHTLSSFLLALAPEYSSKGSTVAETTRPVGY